MIDTSATVGKLATRTCTAPTAMTAANAATGYLRRNATGTASPTMIGVSTGSRSHSGRKLKPQHAISSAVTPSTTLGWRRSQPYSPCTGPGYVARYAAVVPLQADLQVSPQADPSTRSAGRGAPGAAA